jgi:hypothetical protein
MGLRIISENLQLIHLTVYYYDDKNAEGGLGGNLAHTEKKCMQNFYGKYLKERDHKADLNIDGIQGWICLHEERDQWGIFVKTFELQ